MGWKIFSGVSVFLYASVLLGLNLNYLGVNTNLIAGPISGALLATLITLFVTYLQKETDKKKEKMAFIGTICAELEALIDLINARWDILMKMKAIFPYGAIEEDYFTVFSQNAGKLGILPRRTSKQIIRAYMDVKGLFDSARLVYDVNSDIANKRYAQSTPEYLEKQDSAQKLLDEFLNKQVPDVVDKLGDLVKELKGMKD